MSAMKENGLSENINLQTLGDLNKAERKEVVRQLKKDELFPYDRTDPQDHDSRRNKNFTYNQNSPSR